MNLTEHMMNRLLWDKIYEIDLPREIHSKSIKTTEQIEECVYQKSSNKFLFKENFSASFLEVLIHLPNKWTPVSNFTKKIEEKWWF